MLRRSQQDGKIRGPLFIFLLSDSNLAAYMEKGAFVGTLRNLATGWEQPCPPRNPPGSCSSESLKIGLPTSVLLKILKIPYNSALVPPSPACPGFGQETRTSMPPKQACWSRSYCRSWSGSAPGSSPSQPWSRISLAHSGIHQKTHLSVLQEAGPLTSVWL